MPTRSGEQVGPVQGQRLRRLELDRLVVDVDPLRLAVHADIRSRAVADEVGLSYRPGAANDPDDTMRMTGEVTKKDGNQVEVTLKGTNGMGDHVVGTVTLELPA